MAIKKPENLSVPFALNGLKNEIPIDPVTGENSNRASWKVGFGPITMTPVTAGGKPPLGQDFNGILNTLSSHTVFQNTGGQYRFDAELVAAIGGYPAGAVLQSDDGLSSYVSLVDNNTDNFNIDPSVIGTSWYPYAGEAIKALPPGTSTGQTLVWNQEEEKWSLGFLSGIPIGQLTLLPYDDAPKGFVKISYHQETPIALASFPDAEKLACPSEYNDEADFFYRANNADGTSRSATGTFLMLPAAARYFFRAHDPDGGVGQYQYQQDQMQRITGDVSLYVPQNGKANGAFYNNGINPNDGVNIDGTAINNAPGTAAAGGEKTLFDSALSPSARTGNETRPMSIPTFRAFIKLWDAAVVPSDMDVQGLVNEWSGMAGLKLDRSKAYGIGQTLVNVAGIRTFNTLYENTSDAPITVFAWRHAFNGDAWLRGYLNGLADADMVANNWTGAANYTTIAYITFEVPPGAFYALNGNWPIPNDGSKDNGWKELK